MNEFYYYTGARKSYEGAIPKIVTFVIDEVIKHFVGVREDSTEINVLYKYAAPADTANAVVELKYKDDEWYVAGTKVAVGSIATAGIAEMISTGIVASVFGTAAAVGAIAIGFEIAVAAGITLIYESFVSEFVEEQIDQLFHVEEHELVLRDKDNTVICGIWFPNGNVMSGRYSAQDLMQWALRGMGSKIPEVGSRIDYIYQGDVAFTYRVQTRDILEAVGQAVGATRSEAEGWAWGAGYDGVKLANKYIVIDVKNSDYVLVDDEAELAILIYDEEGSLVRMTAPVDQIGVDGRAPVQTGGVQFLFNGDGNASLSGNSATKIYAIGGGGRQYPRVQGQ